MTVGTLNKRTPLSQLLLVEHSTIRHIGILGRKCHQFIDRLSLCQQFSRCLLVHQHVGHVGASQE